MKAAGASVFTLILLTLPFWLGNPYYLHVAIMAGVFGVLGLSLHLLLRYTGRPPPPPPPPPWPPLGPPAFFGIGAYPSALLTLRLEWPLWPAMLGAVALAALAGWLIGRLAL